MYYEECVVDGVLCHRNTPNGEWIPHTLEFLTQALVDEREARKSVEDQDEFYHDRLKAMLDAAEQMSGVSIRRLQRAQRLGLDLSNSIIEYPTGVGALSLSGIRSIGVDGPAVVVTYADSSVLRYSCAPSTGISYALENHEKVKELAAEWISRWKNFLSCQ